MKIPGVDFAAIEKDFTEHGRNYALDFLSILDHHRGTDKTPLKNLAAKAESQTHRFLFILPDKEA